jgi:hypothetical protein
VLADGGNSGGGERENSAVTSRKEIGVCARVRELRVKRGEKRCE